MSKRKISNNHRQNRQKRRMRFEMDENQPMPPPISSTLIISILLIRFILQYFSFFTGYDEKPRIRKDLDKDVFDPLGDYLIYRAFRMSRESLYLLHDILEPLLNAKFFPKNGGTRDPSKNPYLSRQTKDLPLQFVILLVDLHMILC